MEDSVEHDAPRLDRSTILAYDRTRLSYQRTLLSWVRTGTSLITFGFAMYSFHRVATGDEPRSYLIGPHQVALMMVSIGLVALLLATLEYRHNIRILSAEYPDIPQSLLPAMVALLISTLGMLTLIVMIFRQ